MTAAYLVAQFKTNVAKTMNASDRARAIDMAVDIMFDRGFALRAEERTGTLMFKMTFMPVRARARCIPLTMPVPSTLTLPPPPCSAVPSSHCY